MQTNNRKITNFTLITGSNFDIIEMLAFDFAEKKYNLFIIYENESLLIDLNNRLISEFGIESIFLPFNITFESLPQLVVNEINRRNISVTFMMYKTFVNIENELESFNLLSNLIYENMTKNRKNIK